MAYGSAFYNPGLKELKECACMENSYTSMSRCSEYETGKEARRDSINSIVG